MTTFATVLESLGANTNAILAIYVGEEDKTFTMYPDTDMPEGYDPTGRPWYLGAIKTDGIYATEPYTDASTGDFIISLAKKIKKNGKDVVAGIDIDFRKLVTLLGQIDFGEGSETFLSVPSGLILYHNNQDLIGKNLKDIKNEGKW